MSTFNEAMRDFERYDIRGTSMGVYSAEVWERLLTIPEADIEMTYAEYLRKLERTERDFVARGIEVKKVPIDDVDQMIAWCHRNGYEIDSKGRAVYGAALAMADGDPAAMNKPIIDKTRNIQ